MGETVSRLEVHVGTCKVTCLPAYCTTHPQRNGVSFLLVLVFVWINLKCVSDGHCSQCLWIKWTNCQHLPIPTERW